MMTFAKFKPFLIGVGILLVAIVIVLGLRAAKPKTEQEESETPPLVVRTVDVELKEQIVFASFQGEVRAKTNIELVTQVTGKVMSVSDNFIEGGEFKAGDTLIQIDDSDYLVALKSAEASVASAQVDVEVELATAANRAKEWQDLQGKPIEQANPLLLNKPQIDRAKARLAAAQAELAAANLNYQRTKISAPFDGRIMAKSAELGQFMSRGASVGRVFATDSMEVRIPMTDLQISELGLRLGYSAGGEGIASIPAKVSTLFGDQRHEWQGFLKSIDASVDAQTRLLFATIVVEQPFEQTVGQSVPLVPGLFVDVQLASPKKLSGLEFPRAALRNGNQVYVYSDDVLHVKPVSVIYTSSDKVIVAQSNSAIDAGEKIITSSVPGAYEGMPIKLLTSPAVDQLAVPQWSNQPVLLDSELLPPAEKAESSTSLPEQPSDHEQQESQSLNDLETGASSLPSEPDSTAQNG